MGGKDLKNWDTPMELGYMNGLYRCNYALAKGSVTWARGLNDRAGGRKK